MDKHLLVTLSTDMSALHGVRFVSNFFSSPEHIRVTFFYTDADPKSEVAEAGGQVLLELSCDIDPAQSPVGGALEKARQLLCGRGFGAGRMDAKIVFKRYSKIMDIILESEKGLYDALVLGHRGLTRLEEAFGSSVSRGVLEKHVGAPLWICREVEEGRKNVLLCVDGSSSSLSMADHVGFMLESEPGHEVTLMTVIPKDGDEGQRQANKALEASMAALLENNISEERISAHIVESRNVAESILAEADAGRYAVVAMGRTGVGQGRFPRLFMGSASDTIYQQLKGAALWVCR
ncbi:MAG: universal stress protein [Proteobacteria bacterium]|nr:universal stress protein [Pseudomonadota bacterium]